MSVRSQRIMFFISILVSIIAFWDFKAIYYLKSLIVLLHEICHAGAALISGSSVENILIHANEEGETLVQGNMKLSFIFVVSAGYIGSSFLGGYLLKSGFQKTYAQKILGLLGILILVFTYFYSYSHAFTFQTGFVFAVLFIICSMIHKEISALVLIYLGVGIALYSVYDLMDFVHNIHNSDAGILARWLVGKSGKFFGMSSARLGLLIAFVWSIISASGLLILLKKTFEEPDKYKNMNKIQRHLMQAQVNPEVAQWFLSRGLDLDGKPLSKNWASELKKKVNNENV